MAYIGFFLFFKGRVVVFCSLSFNGRVVIFCSWSFKGRVSLSVRVLLKVELS